MKKSNVVKAYLSYKQKAPKRQCSVVFDVCRRTK
jgi:hypothetical protein